MWRTQIQSRGRLHKFRLLSRLQPQRATDLLGRASSLHLRLQGQATHIHLLVFCSGVYNRICLSLSRSNLTEDQKALEWQIVTTRVGVFIVAQDKVLVIRRCKKGRRYWVFPGGKKENGETDLEAIVREIKEETDLTAPASQLAKVLEYTNQHRGGKDIYYLWQISNVCPVELVGEEKEQNGKDNSYELVWLSFDKLKALGDSLFSAEARKWILSQSSL